VSVIAFHSSPSSGGIADVRLLPWQESRLARAAAVESAQAGIDVDVVHDLGVGWSADVLQPQMGCRLANYRHELRSLGMFPRLVRKVRPGGKRWLKQIQHLEERQYRSLSNLIVAVSRMVADDLKRFHSVQPERVQIIPNGVDTVRFAPAATEMRERARRQLNLTGTVYLFAARNPGLKGLDPLLKAFAAASARQAGLRLVVAGKNPGDESLRFVRRERLEEAVLFAGSVEDIGLWYSAADAFVLPTWYDACSLGVLEACACGLPVITTCHNGAAELLTDGREGRVIRDAGDVGALRDALIELAEPSVRKHMGNGARALAASHTFEHNVDELERVYGEILERRVRRLKTA
jgi:UDP-glucose:(heptosyl)LPS alpha-1,3-glucosyltransferase